MINKKNNNSSNIRKRKIISDKLQNEHLYNRPNERLKEIQVMRIVEDENIEYIYQEIKNIKHEIIKIKQQISAHDYHITNLLKNN